jgi:hypothetical protein
VSLARGSDRPGDTIKRSDPADEKVFLEKVFLKKISRLNLKTPLFNSYQWWQENQTKIDGLKGSTRVTFALRPDIDQVSVHQDMTNMRENSHVQLLTLPSPSF